MPTNPHLEWVEDLPNPVQGSPDPGWEERLAPLVEVYARYDPNGDMKLPAARVWVMASAESAAATVSSLRRGRLKIPYPNTRWEFSHQGPNVYARWHGPHSRRPVTLKQTREE